MPSLNPMVASAGPFHLGMNGSGSLTNALLSLAQPAIERLLAFPQLNLLHEQINRLDPAQHFSRRALDALNVTLTVSEADLSRVPASGPLVCVANHPFGGVDGLALVALLQRRRPDVRILANHLLGTIPEMKDVCFFVDPFGGECAKRRNLAGMRAAIRWVRDGGALAVFPAGEVSSLNVKRLAVADGAWSKHVAALARKTGASVLTVFFGGRNSTAFQCAGMISPRLRTLMLPRELLKKRDSRIEVSVGNVIAPDKLKQFESDEDMAAYLRVRTYILAARQTAQGTRERTHPRTSPAVALKPISPAQSANLLKAEIECLPKDRLLAQSGHLHALYGTAMELHYTLREIGRLRELTFRRVGEGTGRTEDLDKFDQTYLHLLVWNSMTQEVVGAYRMGLTDQLIQASGTAGLYTSTLFRYRDELLTQLDPAIELGRSFVRPEYQKEYAPLMLLWRGIATFAARNPRYRMLFGPVSISNEYHSFTRQLLIEFLKHNNCSADLQKLVTPKNPPRFGPGRNWEARLAGTIVRSVETIDELVGEIESDRSGIPVLLRQYLKLNAKLLGFNVDPDFGDVLDGLMLVDLTQVQRAILVRYMGREGATEFLQFHGHSWQA